MDRWRFSGASSSDTADDGAAVEMWRRPESVWMEYVFEWNPLLAGKPIKILQATFDASLSKLWVYYRTFRLFAYRLCH